MDIPFTYHTAMLASGQYLLQVLDGTIRVVSADPPYHAAAHLFWAVLQWC